MTRLTNLEKFLLIFATDASCFFASLFFVSQLNFVAKLPISLVNLILAAIMTLGFHFWFARLTKVGILISLNAALFAVGLFLLCLSAQTSVWDTSYDGQAYHQEAIALLSYGWNPVYLRLSNEATANLEIWLNHYPKANWIIAANFYRLTGSIESGKVLSIFAGSIAFAFVLFGLGRTKIALFWKVALSLLITLNPVYLYQSFSYYIDGVLVSLLLSLAFISYRIVTQKEKYLFWPFVFLAAVLINIKLTAVIWFAFLVAAFFAYLWFGDRMKLAIWYGKTAAISLVIGLLLLGFNPFVTNFVTRGSMFYPALGKGAYDYVKTNTPQNYWELPPPLRLVSSIFAKSSLARGEGKFSELKWPVIIYQEELLAFRETNAKTSGFGPLYGLAFIISLLGLLILLSEKNLGKARWLALCSLLIIFGSAAITPTSSVARYVPFVWWFPTVVAIFLFTGNSLGKIVASLIAFVLTVNVTLVGVVYFPFTIEQSQKVRTQLLDIALKNQAPLAINFGQFGSTKLKLQNYEIPYVEIYPDQECPEGKQFLTRNVARICQTKTN